MNKIGQEEIAKVLIKADKPLARVEIAKQVGDSPNKVSKYICKMIKRGEIDYIDLDRIEALRLYNSKRRLRLFFWSSKKFTTH